MSNAHAQRIRAAAGKAGIQVIVNYETTWYPSHGDVWTLIKERGAAGDDPQDGGARRPQRSEGDQRAAGVSRLALRPGQERRRRAVRFRLLRREPDDLADGQPASARRDGGHAAASSPRSTRAWTTKRRSCSSIRRRRASSRRRGTGRSTARTWRCTASMARRSPPAATACASPCRTSRSTP